MFLSPHDRAAKMTFQDPILNFLEDGSLNVNRHQKAIHQCRKFKPVVPGGNDVSKIGW